MIGLYFASVAQNTESIDAALKLAEDKTGEAVADYFVASPASSKPEFNETKVVSLFVQLKKASLDSVMFVAPLRNFCDAYSLSLLSYTYNAVKHNGYILIPFYEEQISIKTGYWNINWIRSVIGKEEKIYKEEGYALFKRTSELELPKSILTAFFNEPRNIANEFAKNKLINKDFLNSCSKFLLNPGFAINSNIQRAIQDMPDINNDLEEFYAYISYSVSGVSYKTQAIRRFIEIFLKNKKNLTALDVGGGIGLVLFELLLTCSNINNATVCEPLASTLPITKKIYEMFNEELEGRYNHIISAVQDYNLLDKYDVICEFASLLYIPREKLELTIDKLWKSLNPGGILIIHENIKRDIFKSKSYYDMVFTSEELESYLNKYGKINYYRSSDICPMNKDKTKDLTVFRVLQKEY